MNASDISRAESGDDSIAYGSKFLQALEVLELYRPGVGALSSEEIARRSGTSLTVVRRLLERLACSGYIATLDNAQRYWPTVKLDWLGNVAHLRASRVVESTLPAPANPETLALICGQREASVVVAVRKGMLMHDVARWASSDAAASGGVPEERRLHLSSLGHAWLWAESRCGHYGALSIVRRMATTSQIAALYQAFAQFETKGYCLYDGHEGWLMLTAPVLRHGKLVASVACAARRSKGLEGVLRRAADAVATSGVVPQ